MKITDVKTYLVGVPNRSWNWLFLKLSTDEGIEGVGECTNWAFRDDTMIQSIRELGKHFVLGWDPFKVELLWQRIYAGIHDFHHSGMIETPVLSAFEMACWDIVGKYLKQPIYNLLGGPYWDRLRAYSGLSAQGTPQEVAKRAVTLVDQGFTCFKFDPLGGIFDISPRDMSLKTLQFTEDCVREIRDSVGNDADIGLGTHGECTTHAAIRVAKRIERYDVAFFEEPVPPENVDEMARVAAHTSIPIATGERLLTKYEFLEVLQKQAAQILQLDVSHCGGIMEAKKIAAMAEGYYAQIAPHMPYGPVSGAAAVQVDMTCPNFIFQEGGAWTGFRQEIAKELPVKYEKGYLIPFGKPGLGVELDEEVCAKNPPHKDSYAEALRRRQNMRR